MEMGVVGLALVLALLVAVLGVHRYLQRKEMDLRSRWLQELKIALPTFTSSPRLHGAYLWPTSGLGQACISGSSLQGMPWEYITALFERTATKISPSLFVLLTDQPAAEAAETTYVHFEPFESPAHQGLVIALSYAEKKACIHADGGIILALDAEFRKLTDQADELLRHGWAIEALVFSLEQLGTISPILLPQNARHTVPP